MEHKKDVIYRTLGEDLDAGILACGYMPKVEPRNSQYDFMIHYYSCFLVLEGHGTYYTEDGTRIPMEKGDLVQRFPDKLHSTEIVLDGTWLEFFFCVGRPVYDMLMQLHLLPKEPVCHCGFNQALLYEFDELLQTLKHAKDQELSLLLPQMEKLMLTLFLQCNQQLDKKEGLQPQLEAAAQILSTNFTLDISMEQVAELVHIGYETFRREFTARFGCSPARYRTRMKMQRGALMLLGDASISDCAQACGYSDVYAFTKQFTKTYGIAPGKYRNQEL